MTGHPHPAAGHGRVRERLYELLPAFLRYRDQSDPLDSPLRALMAVLERQHTALERDIQTLYDDWFIETCQDWVAPYLGDLLGIRGLDRPEAWVPGQRTRIANALAYRRRKGTTAVLERVARDVTGWACVAKPFFDRVSCSQSMEHVRPGKGATVDVRDGAALARLGGPFDPLSRRPQISGSRGLEPRRNPTDGYNLPNLGLYFWRLQSYPLRRASARRISPGCYTFHPLGVDQPLFNRPRGVDDLSRATAEGDVAGPLSREILAEEIAARRRGEAAATEVFGARPALEIFDPRTAEPVPWRAIEIADLGEWRRPEPRAEGSGAEDRILVAVDPELGRLAFAADHPVTGEVEVSYHQARPGDIGGGPYYREGTVVPSSGPVDEEIGPAATPADGSSRFRSLQEALEARPQEASRAVVQLVDSATYGGWRGLDLEIRLSPGGTLEIGAAPGESPVFIGDLRLVVEPGEAPSRLTLEGLTVGGRIVIATGGDAGAGSRHACELEIRHCTLTAPDLTLGDGDGGVDGGLAVDLAAAEALDLAVSVRSSILGPIAIPPEGASLAVFDSIIDGGPGAAISGDGCSTELSRCTVLGPVAVARLRGRDSLFSAPVAVTAPHLSRLSHCYLPAGSAAGTLERCQPVAAGSLAPVFTSRRYGQPGYAQLAGCCPREIRAGAANGSEMGAFSSLGNPFRETNLAGILEEYMPWGLAPCVFHVT